MELRPSGSRKRASGRRAPNARCSTWRPDRAHRFNLPELVVAYCACFRTGAIAVPLNARYKADELRAMIARVQPVLYLGQAGLFEAIKATKANAKRKSHIP